MDNYDLSFAENIASNDLELLWEKDENKEDK